MKKSILLLNLSAQIILSQPTLNVEEDNLKQLKNYNLASPVLKLHIGCGQTYFKGYINIDFPPDQHTVQNSSKADVFADITQLKFSATSINEIRSHHVFEHFDRQMALAMLCAWQQWLKIDGVLVIETPDFEASIQLLQKGSLSYAQKQGIMRHIFGSHEARWAIHCDGWYQEKFHHILKKLGFDEITFEKTQWQLTNNIIIRAKKTRNLDSKYLIDQAKTILAESLIDNSESEQLMLSVWFEQFVANFKSMLN